VGRALDAPDLAEGEASKAEFAFPAQRLSCRAARRFAPERVAMKKIGETPWTAEQTETMTRLWNSGLSASLIAPQVGFSRGAVLGKLHRLGLLNRRPTTMPTVRTSRLWPEENVAPLRRLYAEGESYETIALACGVSKASVRNKAQNLGLRRRAIRTRWTDERVDQLRRLWIEGKTAAEAARALALPVGVFLLLLKFQLLLLLNL